MRHSINKTAAAAAVGSILLFCLVTSCAKKDRARGDDAKQQSALRSADDSLSLVPPLDLLESNCQAATHAALVDVKKIVVADSIFADDGTLGYVVERSTADVIKSFKGDFGKSPEIQFFNFLEYPTAPVKERMDSQLVFLNLDSTNLRLQVIEVGEFPYNDSLGNIMNSIDCGK